MLNKFALFLNNYLNIYLNKLKYGINLDSSGDWGNMKYVGYDTRQSQATQYLFDKSTIKTISSKITELLQGVEKNGKQIIVTDNIITNVISSLLAKNNIGNIGDIYSRYTIARQEPDCGVSSIIDEQLRQLFLILKINMV